MPLSCVTFGQASETFEQMRKLTALLLKVIFMAGIAAASQPGGSAAGAVAPNSPAVRAADFHSARVYQSAQHPSYTSWVSFFPGERGRWYLGCEEVTSAQSPLPAASKDWVYGMSLPRGYDQSKYQMELVLLESEDQFRSWKVISRAPVKASGGSFAQARTKEGRFLRFVWAAYSTDPSATPADIYYQSDDNGSTWKRMPPFVNDHFVWYPHRLRTLRDGTLVLCAPLAPKWGRGTGYPIRAAINLDAVGDMQMNLFISHDGGKKWSGPVPILAGQNVSETDFVELTDGNLLFINNSIFPNSGRQMVYREGNQFTPGPLERVHSGTVPETVCLAGDDLLIGCHRPGVYFWSDDLGQNWQPLEGAPTSIEVYQPWIQYLGNGRVACAGHLGADDPIHARDQYISLHTFNVQVLRQTARTRLWIERNYDVTRRSFLNSYTVTLSGFNPTSPSNTNSAGAFPLPSKDVEVWYVSRDAPGYDPWNKKSLGDRMKLGGKTIVVTTRGDGQATFSLPEFDGITDIHQSYQMVVRFNPQHQYPPLKPAQLPQLEFYANHGLDP
jgi:hypothetical protein